MIMQDQSRRLSEPLRWGRREKTIVAALLGCVAVAAILLAVVALTTSTTLRKGCIEATFASTLGAAQLHACGAQARKICGSPEAYPASAQQLQVECRRAGYRFAPR